MRFTEEHLLEAIEALVESADDNGCTRDLTVVSSAAVERLRSLATFARQRNVQARDKKHLAELVLDTQQACNPRPVVEMLSDCIFTTAGEGGTGAPSQSPLVRIATNTLLNILGPYHSLPAYDQDCLLYGRDVDAVEILAGRKEAPATADAACR